jgi:hypothetical protein
LNSQRHTWQGSVRVSRHLLAHCRKRALEEGWQLSELARTLICLGATIYFLRLRNPEALERFMRLAKLSRASRALDMTLGRPRGHRNEPKHLGETTLLPVHLPKGFYELVSTYSSATGTSRNALLSRFLETGWILYTLGEETWFKTILSLRNERQASSGETSRNNRLARAVETLTLS